ncbi:MAG TPA: helix-turn-helix domain-containing protein [Thermosynechococcaceae cyanobacterium]
MTVDRTPQLQILMQQAGFSSFKSLAQAAAVSERQIRQIRRGDLSQLRLETLQKLSQALGLSLTELLASFDLAPSPAIEALQQEYDRLQAQLAQQQQELRQEFQQSSLQILESLLLQLPTAAYAAQQNPQAPAVKLLPLLRPIDHLLEAWGVVAIAAVGSEVAYDPQQHQLMEGTVQPGESVRVRYTGYRQGDRWLHRAKVSPIVP